MKSFIRSIVVLTLLVLSVSAYAQTASDGWGYWQWIFTASVNDNDIVNASASEFQVHFDASDNYDSFFDKSIYNDTPAIYAATYHDKDVDGWNGPAGFYQRDVRSPVPLQEGQSKNWQIYVWATPDVPITYNTIDIGCSSVMPNPIYWPEDLNFNLTLKAKPQGITGGPDVGTTWELLPHPHGVGIQLPMYRTDNGLTGYQFELTATAVPEPSSIIALLCGIGGLTAFRIRRRK